MARDSAALSFRWQRSESTSLLFGTWGTSGTLASASTNRKGDARLGTAQEVRAGQKSAGRVRVRLWEAHLLHGWKGRVEAHGTLEVGPQRLLSRRDLALLALL